MEKVKNMRNIMEKVINFFMKFGSTSVNLDNQVRSESNIIRDDKPGSKFYLVETDGVKTE